jgi:hypothetical protein
VTEKPRAGFAPTQRQLAALLAAVVDRKDLTRRPEPELDLVEFARELAELRERDPAAAREKARRFLEGVAP